MINFQEELCVLHIWWDGNTSCSWAEADEKTGEPIFGFEWGTNSVEALQEFINNEEHTISLSVDGGDLIDVKSYYQEVFLAEPGPDPNDPNDLDGPPPWTWDHDNDGFGDLDNDGWTDWNGPTIFFRYPARTHWGATDFEFCLFAPSPPFDPFDMCWTYTMAGD